ncbi:MAG TPA: isochorismatase family protein [Sedimentisphaerales bacterium]|nr:isochorismatase family protein [Sedimentisphaerales bacterium]
MIRQLLKHRNGQIIVDVSTQKDLFLSDGIARVRNHRRVLANIRRVMAYARRRDVYVISTCEVYSNVPGHTPYCLDGTEGYKKIRYTILNNRVSFAADGNASISKEIFKNYKQLILNERGHDPFEEPAIDRLLSDIKSCEFIIIGATAEKTVKAMALGLLQRGKRVTVVYDAVGSHDNKEAKMAFRKMQAKGAKLIETKKLAGISHLRQVRSQNLSTCPN